MKRNRTEQEIENDLLDFIRDNYNSGKSFEEIESVLVSSGFDRPYISRLIRWSKPRVAAKEMQKKTAKGFFKVNKIIDDIKDSWKERVVDTKIAINDVSKKVQTKQDGIKEGFVERIKTRQEEKRIEQNIRELIRKEVSKGRTRSYIENKLLAAGFEKDYVRRQLENLKSHFYKEELRKTIQRETVQREKILAKRKEERKIEELERKEALRKERLERQRKLRSEKLRQERERKRLKQQKKLEKVRKLERRKRESPSINLPSKKTLAATAMLLVIISFVGLFIFNPQFTGLFTLDIENNSAPELIVEDLFGYKDRTLEVPIDQIFNDEDSDKLFITVEDHDNLTAFTVENVLRINPNEGYFGRTNITLKVSDLKSTRNFTIPVFIALADQVPEDAIPVSEVRHSIKDRFNRDIGKINYTGRPDGKFNILVEGKGVRNEANITSSLRKENKEDDKTRVMIKGAYATQPEYKLRIDEVAGDKRISSEAIMVEDLEVEQAEVRVRKTGRVTRVMKCVDQDIDLFICREWVTTSTPFIDEGDYIVFNVTGFSGYAGGDIEVINVQSYPSVGGNWTVLFNTTGTANLTITAIRETTWSDVARTEDLLFKELRCGNSSVPAQWIDNGINRSVFVENYNCDNETSYEISEVLTPGKHNLQFNFGEDKSYANNFASSLTVNSYTVMCGNITEYDEVIVTGSGYIDICNQNSSGESGYLYFDLGVYGNFTVEGPFGTVDASGAGMDGGTGTTFASSGTTQCGQQGGDGATRTTGSYIFEPCGENGGGGGGHGRWSTSSSGGGSGGGFGGAGGRGGRDTSLGAFGDGGSTYGSSVGEYLQIGSGGGGQAGDSSARGKGGRGGGGFKVDADLGWINVYGNIYAYGYGGNSGDSLDDSGGGGGSGGHIIIRARNITLNSSATISAYGGAGGSGFGSTSSDSCGGGGGGGGRILYIYEGKTGSPGSESAAGGSAGSAVDTGCQSAANTPYAGSSGTTANEERDFPIPPNVVLVAPVESSDFDMTDEIEIAANVTDDLAEVDNVSANITYPNGTLVELFLLNETPGDPKYNTSFTAPRLAGLYSVSFIANNTNGSINMTTTTNFTVNTDPLAPNVTNLEPSQDRGIGELFNISADIVDANYLLDVTEVTFKKRNNTEETLALAQASGDTYAVEITLPNIVGNYTLEYFANNTNGNLNDAEVLTFNLTFSGFHKKVSDCDGQDFSSKDLFFSACDEPGGSYLEDNDDLTEGHSSFNGDFWGGVRITSIDEDLTSCEIINSVELCYEWWYSRTSGSADPDLCEIAVDADGGNNYTVLSETCPLQTPSPGEVCSNISSIETWTCENFFGASGTRAYAVGQLNSTECCGDVVFDTFYFRVNYSNSSGLNPNVTVVKTDSADPVQPTQEFTYRINLTENGGAAATYVNISDILPSGVTYSSAEPSPMSVDGQEINFSINLSATEEYIINITVTLDGNVNHGTTLNNTASVSFYNGSEVIVREVSETTSTRCQFINEDFTMTEDIDSEGDCLVVNASNVVIDGAGYKLTGNNEESAGSGIVGSGFNNVTIKGFANISKFVNAINVSDATDIKIFDLEFATKGTLLDYGINIDNVSSSNITNITHLAHNPASTSILMQIQNSNDNLIQNIDLTCGTPTSLMYSLNSHNNTYFNNKVESLGFGVTLRLETSNDSNITENNLTNLGETPLWVKSSNRTWISKNIISTGEGSGILVDVSTGTPPHDTRIVNNTITTTESSSHGIQTSGSVRTNISDHNYISTSGTSAYGVYMSSEENGSISNTTIVTAGSAGFGIYISSSDNAIVKQNNISTGNGVVTSSFGIFISLSPDGTVEGNNISTTGNFGYGISIIGFTSARNEIRENKVRTNGNIAYGFVSSGGGSQVHNNNIMTQSTNSHGMYFELSDDNNLSNNYVVTTGEGSASLRIDGTNTTAYRDSLNSTSDSEIEVSSAGQGILLREMYLLNTSNITIHEANNVLIEYNESPNANPSGLINLSDFIGIAIDNGLVSSTAINFTLNYTDAEVAGQQESTAGIYFYNTTSSEYELLSTSSADTGSNTVNSGNLTHLFLENYSDFASLVNETTDDNPPNVTDLVPVNASRYNVSTTIEIASNVTDDSSVSSVTANLTISNGTVEELVLTNGINEKHNTSYTVPNVTGEYNVSFFANDSSNNINDTEETRFVVVDQINPEVSIISPIAATNTIQNESVLVRTIITDHTGIADASVTVEGPSTYQNFVLFGEGGDNYNGTFNTTTEIGRYNVTIFVNDSFGNSNNTETSYFNVTATPDSVAPVVTLRTPGNRTWSNTENNEFTYNVTDDYSVENCSIYINDQINETDDSIFKNISQSLTVNDMSEGNSTWNVECTDIGDNSANSTQFILQIDLTAPEIVIGSPSTNHSTTDPTPPIVFESTDNLATEINYSVYVDGLATGQTGAVSNSSTTNISLSPALSRGQHNVTIELTDQAGNKANSTTLNITIAPPTVFLGPPDDFNITRSSVNNFSFYVEDPDYSFLDNCTFRLEGIDQDSILDAPRDTNLTFNKSGMTDGANQSWSIYCVNQVGSSSEDSRYITVDTQMPSVGSLIPEPNTNYSTGETISINATVIDNIDVQTVRANLTLPNGSSEILEMSEMLGNVYNVSFTLPDQVGTYNVSILANDTAGNMNDTEATYFGTGSSAVVELLRPSNGNTTLFNRQVNLNWSATDPDNDTIIDYDINITSASAPNLYIENVTTTNYTTSLLEADTVYNWTVRAYDGNSEGDFAPVFNFTIASSVEINILRNNVQFGPLFNTESNDTADDSPEPFLIENLGNVLTDVFVYAYDDFFANHDLNTSYFQFKADSSNETGSFNTGSSQTTYANITGKNISIASLGISELNFTSSNNTGEIDIRVEIPQDEPSGGRNVILAFTGEAS